MLGALAWRLPYLMRVLVHVEHAKLAALERALDLARGGQVRRAIWRLKGLAWFRSTKAQALGHLGWLQLERGRPRQAVKYYRCLLALEPENEEAQSLLDRAVKATGG